MLLLSLPIPGRDANGNPLPARPVTVPFTVPITGTVTVTGPSTVTVRDTTGNTLGAPGLVVGFDGSAGATYIATVAGTPTGYLTATLAPTPPASTLVLNVKDYGAAGDGIADDTVAVQAAIDACSAGGTVFFPAGTYLLSTALNVAAAGVSLIGASRLATTLVQTSDSNPIMSWAPATGSIIQTAVRDLSVQYSTTGSSTAFAFSLTPASGAGVSYVTFERVVVNFAGGGLQAVGNVQAVTIFDCVWGNFHDAGLSAIRMSNGAGGMNVIDSVFSGPSASGSMDGLHLDGGSGTVRIVSSYFGVFSDGIVMQNSSPSTETSPSNLVGLDLEVENNGTGMNLVYGSGVFLAESFVSGSQLGPGLIAQSTFTGVVTINGGTFSDNSTQGIMLEGGSDYVVSGARIAANSQVGVGDTVGIQVQGSSSKVVVSGCRVGGTEDTQQVYGVYLTDSCSDVNITGCDVTGNENAGIASNTTGGGVTISHCVGYNPVGPLTAPAIPTSGTAVTNTFGVDATVYVTGGTVTAIAVDGTDTGVTSGAVRLAPGQTITLTYSAAPTWTWFGD